MRHTIALSDIHLCELEPGTGLWMRYRQAAVSPDKEIAALLDDVLSRTKGDEVELVLNGDVFDFDAPRVRDGESHHHDSPRNAKHAVPQIEAILRDHPVFVEALGRVVAAGHRVVFISGNHDVQLTLSDVRDAVRATVVEAAREALASRDQHEPRAVLQRRVVFRAWFHKTKDGIVLEHGNQYDELCCFRYPMMPFHRKTQTIQPTLGSLVARRMVGRMGYFNPHVDSSYMLSTFGYLAHWARYYLFSRRSLAFAYATGALYSLIELLRVRDRGSRKRRADNVAAGVLETGEPVRRVRRHDRLGVRPAEDGFRRVLRELWVDRVALGAITAFAATLWFVLTRGALSAGALLAPLGFVAYEVTSPKISLDTTWKRVQSTARLIARIHGARAVVLGHTHRPEGVWEDGVFFGNTGSWSAAYRDIACTQPLFEKKPFIWLTSDGDKLTGGVVEFTTQSASGC
jgi:UDP-2,3-diacylglucosamine pyrophosphatase LpxH